MDLTREEQSFLLYLETCAVDHCGYVEGQRINEKDAKLGQKWTKQRYLRLARLKMNWINGPRTHFVILGPIAEEDAARYRKERAHRNVAKLPDEALIGG